MERMLTDPTTDKQVQMVEEARRTISAAKDGRAYEPAVGDLSQLSVRNRRCAEKGDLECQMLLELAILAFVQDRAL